MKFTGLFPATLAIASFAVAAPISSALLAGDIIAPPEASGQLTPPSAAIPRPRPGDIVLGNLLEPRSNLQLTNGDYSDAAVSTPMEITWDGASGATIGTIIAGGWGNSVSWTPTTSGTYAFEISDESGNANYSPQFCVSG